MKVLLAWKLGGGQGHIQRFEAIARLLVEYGSEPVFALKSARLTGLNLPGKIIQSPRVAMKPLEGRSYLFTDILYMFGFSDRVTLRLTRY